MEILWDLIEHNLRRLESGSKASRVIVGSLTLNQLTALNKKRDALDLPLITGEMYFIGSHLYSSRCIKDNYSVEDVLCQLKSAISENSIIQMNNSGTSTVLQSTSYRIDVYGNNNIIDEVVFECTRANPKIEIYSVIPKGDYIKPKK